jgi:ribosomal-protein-alanine N-acetyltransferase
VTRLTLRALEPADLPAIAAIQIESPEAARWDPAAYLDYECMVAVLDGRMAGFLVIRRVAPGEGEILNLAVAKEFRRRGIARELLLRRLAEPGWEWFLEVRESNEAALRFYKSLGFQQVGIRTEYYSGPSESGVVMKFSS